MKSEASEEQRTEAQAEGEAESQTEEEPVNIYWGQNDKETPLTHLPFVPESSSNIQRYTAVSKPIFTCVFLKGALIT